MTDQPADQPTNQPPAAVPGWTPPPTPEKPKKPVWQKPWFLVLAAVALLAVGSAIGSGSRQAPQAAVPASSAPSTSAPEPTATETEEEQTPAEPTADDFKLKMKITKKQCFGSAGCNVSIKVGVAYTGSGSVDDLPSNVDITFEVRGGEDPYTSTIELEDGQYSPDTTLIQTKSSKSKLTAKITAVDSY